MRASQFRLLQKGIVHVRRTCPNAQITPLHVVGELMVSSRYTPERTVEAFDAEKQISRPVRLPDRTVKQTTMPHEHSGLKKRRSQPALRISRHCDLVRVD